VWEVRDATLYRLLPRNGNGQRPTDLRRVLDLATAHWQHGEQRRRVLLAVCYDVLDRTTQFAQAFNELFEHCRESLYRPEVRLSLECLSKTCRRWATLTETGRGSTVLSI
jgi:hypothetical protein